MCSDPLIWQKSYIYAGSRLLSTFTNNGAGGETLEFQHPDRLGTKLVTNNSANTSFEQSTLPFGTALDAETTGTTNQRFTSYDRSSVAQLDYAVNRSYSNGQGRFTSPDPIGMSAASLGNPQSFNMYAYVENNPIDYIDPSGLNDEPIIIESPGRYWDEGHARFLRDSAEQYAKAVGNRGGGGGGGHERGGVGGGGEAALAPNRLASKTKLSESDCDNYLARIFGGENAVVGGTKDPITLDKFDPPNFNGYRDKNGNLPNGFSNRSLGHGPEPYDEGGSTDKGGIIHIYANGDGNSIGPLYTPALGEKDKMGAIFNSKDSSGNTIANRVVQYSTGLKITFVHVAGAKIKDENGLGSVRIGNIGGLGATPKQSPGYAHTHIVFSAGGKRVDPRKVFCGW